MANVTQYPTISMKGRRMYKGLCVSALFFFLVAVHTIRDFGDSRSAVAFNKTNELLHGHQARSLKSFSTFEEDEASCEDVHKFDTKEEQCAFVEATADCENDEGLFEYNYFLYCLIGGDLIPLGAIILAVWWLFCFVGLAVCADDYFCPALVVISKTLHLSPNVAGVTFLAFGNGAPDVFSALAALDSGGDPGLGLGGLLGAGMFVTCVVCGAIAIIRPFRVMQRPFLRDVIFYLCGIYWTFFILWRGKIYLGEAVGFLAVWIVYVVVVIVSGSIYKKQKAKEANKVTGTNGVALENIKKPEGSAKEKSLENEEQKNKNGVDNPNFMPDFTDPEEKKRYLERRTTLEEIMASKEEGKAVEAMNSITEEGEEQQEGENGNTADNEEIGNVTFTIGADDKSSNGQEPNLEDIDLGIKPSDDSKEQDNEEPAYDDVEQISPLRSLLEAMNPINIEEWPEMRWWSRVFEIFKCPLVFLIKITCPVVNYEIEETWNWNKYFFTLQSFIAPNAMVLCLQVAGEMIGGVFPVIGLTLIIGLIAAIAVWFTSVPHEKPKYLEIFGWVGFFVALGWIYLIANEVVAVLQSLGIVMNISTGILGLTLLAWGNSIGDLIADTVMARQGFARMGFAACFGGPFFNLSLGFGIPMVVNMVKNGQSSRPLAMTPVSLMLTGFLMGSLALSLIFLNLRKFAANRVYGLTLLAYYIVFLVMALLAETEVIMKGWRPS